MMVKTETRIDYDALGDVIVALNAIDQAQSQFERGSRVWWDLQGAYEVLNNVDMTPVVVTVEIEVTDVPF